MMKEGSGELFENIMGSTSTPSWTESDMPLDHLLLQGEVNGCIVSLSSSERPPRGWAGVFDWKTHGGISNSLRAGIFTGHEGECCYFPWSLNGKTLHLLGIGIGETTPAGLRKNISKTCLSALEKNLKNLSGIRWALSRSEFPTETWMTLAHAIPRGGDLWITD